MLHATSEITKKVLARINKLDIKLVIPSKGYNAYVIAIEGVNTDLKVNADVINEWNDVAGVLMVNSSGLVQIHGLFKATTEPGLHYTRNPLNSEGAAYILTDTIHKDIWQLGAHKDQSNCLIQTGNKICVNRDKNKDGKRNDKQYCGMFGVNFHSIKGNSVTVGKWSAGCVVIPNQSEHQSCMAKIKASNQHSSNILSKYSLILLDGSKI